MAADYIEKIRTVQPKGPYRLLGWSLGGNVIQAMATQLQSRGEEVSLLVMLDAYPNHFLPIKMRLMTRKPSSRCLPWEGTTRTASGISRLILTPR